MIQELASIALTVKALEIDSGQKEYLSQLLQAVEKQVKTYDFRLQRAGKDKVSLTTLLNRTSEDLAEEQRKVEAANRAKSDFLATMSHEIRTPLNAIIGMTSLLLDTDMTSEQREFASTIRTSGDALLAIINDILDFSKIEAGRIELEQRAFNLHECLESAINLFLDQSMEKGVEILYMIEPRVPADVFGDETRLRQILLNLLSNAVKFTDQGEITISVSVADAIQPPFYELHFSVQDTGLGISPDRVNRLFHSFSQLDSSTTRKYGGTGLGLAISKRLAELMGGTMWVESEGVKGRGSTFHFTIRVKKADKTLPPFSQTVQYDLRNQRILIVDDNTTNLQILSRQTNAWGMKPYSTQSPIEALEWIRRGDTFHVALIDHRMPEMNSMALAKEIRKSRDEKSLPLVLISSIRDKVMEDGWFSAKLLKPIHPSQLYNTLTRILSSQEVLPKTNQRSATSVFDPDMGKRLPLRILLAEDHATNQKLALLTLERLGYRADVAANGLEVLAALERQNYDVILMDMQMPEMDGLEATRIIRGRITDSQHPRIIAITANVTPSDRQACLDAGMNDYLAKPIRVEELVAALNRSNSAGAVPPSKDVPDPKPVVGQSHAPLAMSSPLDPAALRELLNLIGGNRNSFYDLIASFLDDGPPLLANLRKSIKTNDRELLRRTSHTLKASSRDFGAMLFSKLNEQLELHSLADDVTKALELVRQIEKEYQVVDIELKKILAGAANDE